MALKRWATRMDVVCSSEEAARAYATRLNELIKTRQLLLPAGYILVEIGCGEGDYDPNGIPKQPVADISIIPAEGDG